MKASEEVPAWAADTSAPALARLLAAHADSKGHDEKMRSNWRSQLPALEAQMKTMEETIGLLEREVKTTAATLAKVESDERRGGHSYMGSPAEFELTLGALEDKLLETSRELEKLRRLTYFPDVDGYTLRFSNQGTFLGFKELLLEQISGSLSLSVTPGVGAAGQATRVPTVVLRLSGPSSSSGIGGGSSDGSGGSSSNGGSGGSGSGTGNGGGGGGGAETGALLRFLGEGVSLVTRREMLGVALAPNLSMQRIDVAARFVATIPLSYLPRRKLWRPDSGFKIELLHFHEAGPGAPDQLLRVVIGAIVEGLLKTFVHRQLGPHLGDYLRAATDGVELEMELSIRGVPIRTFDAPLSEWAAGKLSSYDQETACSDAAALLGLSSDGLEALLDAQRSLPAMPTEGNFSSIGKMMRYFRALGLGVNETRTAALAELWQETVASMPPSPGSRGGRSKPPDVGKLLARIGALTRKPVTFSISFRRLRLGIALRRALETSCDAAAASLASSGAEHSSARAVLDRFRADASSAIRFLTHNLHSASLTLAGWLRGGEGGRLSCVSRRVFFEGALSLSRLISPPAAKPYAVQARLLPDGRLQVLLSLSKPAGGGAGGGEEGADGSADGFNPALSKRSASRESVLSPRITPPTSPAPIAPQLLSVHVAQLTASLMLGRAEALRLHLVQQQEADPHADPPPAPELPPVVQSPHDISDSGGGGGGGTSAAAAAAAASAANARAAAMARASGALSPPRSRGADQRSTSSLMSDARSPSQLSGVVRTSRLVEVFENQRRLTTFRPYGTADLLPLDPGSWSDEGFKERYVEIDLVPLPPPPAPAPLLPPRVGGGGSGGGGGAWCWVGEWRVDREGGGKGNDGWQYALNWNTGWLSSSNAITLVRRRRWTRRAQLIRPEQAEQAPQPVLSLPAREPKPRPPTSLPGGGTVVAGDATGAAGGGAAGGGAEGLLVGWRNSGGDPEARADKEAGSSSASSASPVDSPPTASTPPALEFGSPSPTSHALLLERSEALEEALEASGGGGAAASAAAAASKPAGKKPTKARAKGGGGAANRSGGDSGGVGIPLEPPLRLSVDPSGTPWSPLVSGGAALLQLSTAPGAHVRVRGQQVELNAQPALLFDHLVEILQEQLSRHPWYAEPVRIACDRAREHLGSARLKVSSAVRVIALVEGDECHVTIEGVPEEAEAAEMGDSMGEGAAGGGVCGTFTNEVNLLDLVSDVQDIYRSFTANLSGFTATPRAA